MPKKNITNKEDISIEAVKDNEIAVLKVKLEDTRKELANSKIRVEKIENQLKKERRIFLDIAINSLGSKNIKDFSSTILNLLCEDLGFDLGTIRIFDEQKQTFNLLAQFGSKSKTKNFVEEMSINDQNFIISTVIRTKKPIFAPDATKIKEYKNLANRINKLKIKSLISWPILNRRKQIVGTLQLSSSTIKKIVAEDILFFESIANVLAIALERQVTEDKLSLADREKERLFEIIAMSPLVFFIWSNEPGYPVEFVSENVNIWDYTPEEFLSSEFHYRDIVHPDDWKENERIENHYKKNTKLNEFPFEYRIKAKDGTYRWVIEYSVAIRNDNGEITHFSGFIFDITQRKITEETLIAREKLLEQIFEHTGAATILINENLIIEKCNQHFELLSGKTKEELEGKVKWIDVLPLPSKERMVMFHEQRRDPNSTIPIEYEFEYTNPQNERRYAYVSVGMLPDTKQSVASIIDFTDRKNAEEMLENERTIFKAIAEATLEKANLQELCTDILQAFTSIVGVNFGAIRVYDSKDESLNAIARIDNHGKLRTYTDKIKLNDENYIIAKVGREKKPITYEDGHSSKLSPEFIEKLEKLGIKTLITYPLINSRQQLLGVIQLVSYIEESVIKLDKTFYETMIEFLSSAMEKVITQQELIDSENRYRRTIETMSDGIIIIEYGKVIFVNDRMVDILDLPREKILNQSRVASISNEDNLKLTSFIDDLIEKGYNKGILDSWVTIKNKQKRFLSNKLTIEYENNIARKITVFTDDKTKEKIAEDNLKVLNEELEKRVVDRTKQLQQLNKELESFSYSISHDLRTPLRSIDGFSQALKEEYSDIIDDTGMNYIIRIRNATTRMSNLIDAILTLSQLSRKKLAYKEINLSEMVKEIANDFKINEPERNILFDISEGITIFADKILIRTVMENLIGNAWKFSSKNKCSEIAFGVSTINNEKTYYIRDNGVGFDEIYSDKLFAVFQRLHTTNEFPGTGIGLAIVQKIITKHNGKIWAESKLGKGSTFYFTVADSKIEDGE